MIQIKAKQQNVSFEKNVEKLASSFLCFIVRQLHLTEDIGSEDEVVETTVVGIHDFLIGALPLGTTFTDEDDFLTNTHHGVHVVGVDDGGDVVFVGDALNEFVDNDTGLWVKT